MKLFDTHFHYYGDSSPQEYCALLPAEFEFHLLSAGGSFAESIRSRDFAGAIEGAWYACGVHPHEAEEFAGDYAAFECFQGDPKLAAVGELGLDYFYDLAPRQRQRTVFTGFLERALAWDLPAIVHCRDIDDRFDAYADCYEILKDFQRDGGRFELHCFAGTPEWAERFLDLGAYLGVTGMVTFNKAKNIRETLQYIPLDRLLLETDSPYLAPVPYRGKTNHPAYLVEVARRVALERRLSFEELCACTVANAFRFFRLPEA